MARTDERTALCALNKALGYVPAAGHALLQRFGAAAPVFDLEDAVLREIPAGLTVVAGDAHATEVWTARVGAFVDAEKPDALMRIRLIIYCFLSYGIYLTP